MTNPKINEFDHQSHRLDEPIIENGFNVLRRMESLNEIEHAKSIERLKLLYDNLFFAVLFTINSIMFFLLTKGMLLISLMYLILGIIFMTILIIAYIGRRSSDSCG